MTKDASRISNAANWPAHCSLYQPQQDVEHHSSSGGSDVAASQFVAAAAWKDRTTIRQ